VVLGSFFLSALSALAGLVGLTVIYPAIINILFRFFS